MSTQPFTGAVYIQGNRWTGKIVTVGSEKDYPTLDASIAANPNNCVHLIYENQGEVTNNIYGEHYFVGVGSNITIHSNGLFGPDNHATKVFWENLIISTPGGQAININGNTELRLHNVKLIGDCVTFTVAWDNSTDFVVFTNVTFERRDWTLANFIEGVTIDRSKITIEKCYIDDSWTEYGAFTGSFATYDVVATPTSGYGYGEGTPGVLISVLESSPEIVYTDKDGLNPTSEPTSSSKYIVYKFKQDGSFYMPYNGTIDYLVVGGGGGGGFGSGGGGGAGGYKTGSIFGSVGLYPVVVGKGGTGGLNYLYQPSTSPNMEHGEDGGDSSFDTHVTVKGGGGGGTYRNIEGMIQDGNLGGSGGGGAVGVYTGSLGGSGTEGQGCAGAPGHYRYGGAEYEAGGGGGAGEAGQEGKWIPNVGSGGGAGGAGILNTIAGGEDDYYAGGGGGAGYAFGGAGGSGIGGAGGYNSNKQGGDGAPNTGSGGGGGLQKKGGDGGSGIVVIRYVYNLDPINRPTIRTDEATSIESTSFAAHGELLDDGGGTIDALGFVYNYIKTGIPTIDDCDGFVAVEEKQSGEIEYPFAGMNVDTEYSIVAYAKNEAGISYGGVVRVLTLAPIIVTSDPCTSTVTSITAHATISPATYEITFVGVRYCIDNGDYNWQYSEQYGDFLGTPNFSRTFNAQANQSYKIQPYVKYKGNIYYGEIVDASTIVITEVKVSPSISEIRVGKTIQLTVIATYSDGTEQDITSSCGFSSQDLVTFEPVHGEETVFIIGPSTGNTIASVSSGGLVTGIAAGIAKIYVYIFNYKETVNLTVVQPDDGEVDTGGVWDGELPPDYTLANLAGIAIMIDVAMYRGSSQQAYLIGEFDDSPPTFSELDSLKASWSSSNPEVATIDEGGLIIGISPGVTFIKCSYTVFDSPDITYNTMVMLRVEEREDLIIEGQKYQYIPLSPIPNQSFRIVLAVRPKKEIEANIFLCWNAETQCWYMTISDPIRQEYYVDSVPLFVGQGSMINILKIYSYLDIGSCYILDISNKGTGKPNANDLGIDFVMLWGYTEL